MRAVCDSLPQGGDLRCPDPIHSICVNVLCACRCRSIAARGGGAFWGVVSFVVILMRNYRRTRSWRPAWRWPPSFQARSHRAFCWAAWRRRRISPCRSWPLNWPPLQAFRLLPPRSRAGSSGSAIASKKTLLASERDRPDISKARREWTAKRQPRMRLEPHRLVFIDETGTTTKMTRLRGRCLTGQRLRSKAPFGHWKTQTFIAGLRCYGLTAPFVVDAPMNGASSKSMSRRSSPQRWRRAMSSSSTTSPPTRAPPPTMQSGPKARGSSFCPLQPRSEPDRDGFRQAQGASARQGR